MTTKSVYECVQCSKPLFLEKDVYGAVPERGHIFVCLNKCTTNVVPYFGEIFCECNNRMPNTINEMPKIIGMEILRTPRLYTPDNLVRFNMCDIKLNKVE